MIVRLEILLWLFGPEKFPGLARKGPQAGIQPGPHWLLQSGDKPLIKSLYSTATSLYVSETYCCCDTVSVFHLFMFHVRWFQLFFPKILECRHLAVSQWYPSYTPLYFKAEHITNKLTPINFLLQLVLPLFFLVIRENTVKRIGHSKKSKTHKKTNSTFHLRCNSVSKYGPYHFRLISISTTGWVKNYGRNAGRNQVILF